MAKGKVKKMITVNAQELAYALVEVGDARRAMTQKVYAITSDRLESIGKRLRLMLDVAGKEEKAGS